jgi:glycosyltransferase involved in cell wall biosynthesis
MRILVVSLKFSPGHFSHMVAYTKLFLELGHDAFLFLSKDYSDMVEEQEIPVLFFEENTRYPEADLVLFHNVSTINHKVADYYKKRGAKIIYVYHEPFDSVSEYLKEGIKQTIKAIGAHYFSTKLLKLSDLVIVPSNFALKLYQKSDIKYCKNVEVIPLLFDDELKESLDINKKEYFSYIGHAVVGHAFDVYLDFIKYAYKKGSKLKFMIATKTNLNKILSRDKILQEMISKDVLKVTHRRPLKNTEINDVYFRSLCVWNIYRRSTQSGVLPKAFMFGTPVITSKVGSFPEYVMNGKNGFILETKNISDYRYLLTLIHEVQNKLARMSLNARETFKRTFWYKAYVVKVKNLLAKITS